MDPSLPKHSVETEAHDKRRKKQVINELKNSLVISCSEEVFNEHPVDTFFSPIFAFAVVFFPVVKSAFFQVFESSFA